MVPIAFALYRVDIDASRLSADPVTLRLMVGLPGRRSGRSGKPAAAEVPTNLRILFALPTPFVVRYLRRVLAGPNGELWFAAHTRAAPEEMRALARDLAAAVSRTGRRTPDLDELLGRTGECAAVLPNSRERPQAVRTRRLG